MKERLDMLIVKRNLVPSREKAKAIIMSGIVYVNGQKEDKAGTMFEDTALIEVRGSTLKYVSRGGLKLEKAIQKEIDKEKREESWELFTEKISDFLGGFRKKLQWAFPDYHYMSSIYPAVEKIPILLPVFWGVRGIRLLWRMILK